MAFLDQLVFVFDQRGLSLHPHQHRVYIVELCKEHLIQSHTNESERESHQSHFALSDEADFVDELANESAKYPNIAFDWYAAANRSLICRF